jgi:hypothetical protein
MTIKFKHFIPLTLTAAIVLGACTAPEEDNNDDTSSEQNDAVVDENANKETETDTESKEDETSEEPLFREDETLLTYTLNGEQKEVPGYLTESDEQNYSLYVSDEFGLTGEEPNKDALYSKEDDAVFMRVETISTDDADYEIILDNMMQTLRAVSVEEEPIAITEEAKLPTGEGITKAVGYEVPKEIGTITGYVFERNDLIVRLTIFDRNTANLTDAFLKMGQTIDVK